MHGLVPAHRTSFIVTSGETSFKITGEKSPLSSMCSFCHQWNLFRPVPNRKTRLGIAVRCFRFNLLHVLFVCSSIRVWFRWKQRWRGVINLKCRKSFLNRTALDRLLCSETLQHLREVTDYQEKVQGSLSMNKQCHRTLFSFSDSSTEWLKHWYGGRREFEWRKWAKLCWSTEECGPNRRSLIKCEWTMRDIEIESNHHSNRFLVRLNWSNYLKKVSKHRHTKQAVSTAVTTFRPISFSHERTKNSPCREKRESAPLWVLFDQPAFQCSIVIVHVRM